MRATMKRATLWCAIVVAGCEKQDPLYCQQHPDDHANCAGADAASSDGRRDAPFDTGPLVDAQLCFGSGAYSVCLTSPPSTPVTLNTGATVDTSASGTLCLATQPTNWIAAGQAPACFVVGTTVTVPNVTVSGNRPLVLLASDTLNLTGTLDVASHVVNATSGPAAPSAGCAAFPAAPTASNGYGGGGAGASFTTTAGDGGTSNNTGGQGGTPAPGDTTAPVMLRAGCTGQPGADGQGAGGAGGHGGGAAYLVAGTSINLAATAVINASGAGGSAAGQKAGGGGGGSGGMIVLRAPTIAVMAGAKLVANGGGGSTGANNGGGIAGSDPAAATPLVSAPTVTGPGGAGAGGAGYSITSTAQAGGNGGSNLGGGGGGGAAGYIVSSVALTGSVVSPAVVVIP